MHRAILLTVLLFTTIARAWLPIVEKVVDLPGKPISLCFAANPDRPVLYMNTHDNVFVAFDCTSREVSAAIEVEYYGTCSDMAWNWRRDKLYVPFLNWPDSIMVIDCTNDSLLGFVPDEGLRRGLAYVSTTDRVYYSIGHALRALDCSADTVVVNIVAVPPDRHLGIPNWDSVGNRVYVGSSLYHDPNFLKAFSCDNDSMVARFDCGIYDPARMLFVNEYRRAYFGRFAVTSSLASIDCEGESLLTTHRMNYIDWSTPVWNPVQNRIYVPGSSQDWDSLYVIDGESDSILKRMTLRWPELAQVAWLPWCNLLYCIDGWNGLSVYDCRLDTFVVVDYALGRDPISLAVDPLNEVVYVACRDSTLWVISDDGSGVAEEEPGRVQPAFSPTILRAPELARFDGRILDITGRDVTGRNTRLSPGVYFVRAVSGVECGASSVRKVVIQR